MAAGIDGSGRAWTPWNHVRAILLLPFMNTVGIPAIILATFRDFRIGSGSATTESLIAATALPFLTAGLALVVRSISLFVKYGHGTLAPWDPTAVLITRDVYRYSRNPMKSGLFLVLIGETILLRSTALSIWALAFMAANVIYIIVSEEPGLRERFGEEYARYCRSVPRWFRLLPYGFRASRESST